MSARRRRALALAAVAVAYVLHQDLWLWDDPRLVAGLPVGLAYHAGYCVAVAALMALLVRFAWPHELEAEADPAAEEER